MVLSCHGSVGMALMVLLIGCQCLTGAARALSAPGTSSPEVEVVGTAMEEVLRAAVALPPEAADARLLPELQPRHIGRDVRLRLMRRETASPALLEVAAEAPADADGDAEEAVEVAAAEDVASAEENIEEPSAAFDEGEAAATTPSPPTEEEEVQKMGSGRPPKSSRGGQRGSARQAAQVDTRKKGDVDVDDVGDGGDVAKMRAMKAARRATGSGGVAASNTSSRGQKEVEVEVRKHCAKQSIY
eukprot:TRINITY_DN30521_c0_g2_i1.p2 TRINITY_DN30521_c0_g2~~TRINITY_DN30521_c0_g2_i1.p2  ORF type:complete len:244 (-),score=79.39 TRINITY_DN30521_c0_g2_i1:1138-1869(-)